MCLLQRFATTLEGPKEALEHHFTRNFATLSVGDVINLEAYGETYELAVLELKPADAVCIIDTVCRHESSLRALPPARTHTHPHGADVKNFQEIPIIMI